MVPNGPRWTESAHGPRVRVKIRTSVIDKAHLFSIYFGGWSAEPSKAAHLVIRAESMLVDSSFELKLLWASLG